MTPARLGGAVVSRRLETTGVGWPMTPRLPGHACSSGGTVVSRRPETGADAERVVVAAERAGDRAADLLAPRAVSVSR
jgi:hypothetical protein